MKIVIDTNVIISAIYFHGKPYELLRWIIEGKVIAVVSKEIVEEYQEVVMRMQNKYPKVKIGGILDFIVSKMSFISVKSEIQICRDPDDDKFINCAMDGECVYIVSGDKDLLDLRFYQDIEIVTVSEFQNRNCY